MKRERGMTILEVVTAMAVVALFAAIAVPSAARVGGAVSGAEAARRLALVLRAAQAEAQSRGGRVLVEVGSGGDYTVTAAGTRLLSGRLGVRVTSTYAGGTLEFTERGWAGLPGASSPRAGNFSVAGATSVRTVVVQLSGCVRCT
jgi:prepilin-type N-terminal cleavage/methylation domain-containing protein